MSLGASSASRLVDPSSAGQNASGPRGLFSVRGGRSEIRRGIERRVKQVLGKLLEDEAAAAGLSLRVPG